MTHRQAVKSMLQLKAGAIPIVLIVAVFAPSRFPDCIRPLGDFGVRRLVHFSAFPSTKCRMRLLPWQ